MPGFHSGHCSPWVAGLGLATVMLAGSPAHGATRGLAVMDARSVGLEAGDLSALHQSLRSAFGTSLARSDFALVPHEDLVGALKGMPGCGVGTCDIQVARRCEANAVVSVEAARVKGEYSLSLRMFETREGALLGRSMIEAASLGELQAQIPAAAQSLSTMLLKAHEAAMAVMKAPGARYQLRPPAGTESAWSAPRAPAPSTGGPNVSRRMVRDAEQGDVKKVLRDVTPALNACYDILLAKNKHARGRMVVELDVETNGQVSAVRVTENELKSVEMEGCVAGRLRRMPFAVSEQAWQVRFPLVFVPAKGGAPARTR